MKIKTTKEIREVEVQTYVADDGTEFKHLNDCYQHEDNLKKQELEACLKGIEENLAAEGFTPLDGCEYYEYNNYRWFKPKNIEEVEALNNYFNIVYGRIDKDDINEWVCIEESDYDVYIAHLRDSVEQIQKFLSLFGYKVTIEKENGGK